jgi:hypothetical protein
MIREAAVTPISVLAILVSSQIRRTQQFLAPVFWLALAREAGFRKLAGTISGTVLGAVGASIDDE